MAKKREIKDYSSDPAAQQMLIRAEELGIGTAFTRADNMLPCNIGGAGMCCKQCGMGPCRLDQEWGCRCLWCHFGHDPGPQPDTFDRSRKRGALGPWAGYGIPAQGDCQP